MKYQQSANKAFAPRPYKLSGRVTKRTHGCTKPQPRECEHDGRIRVREVCQ